MSLPGDNSRPLDKDTTEDDVETKLSNVAAHIEDLIVIRDRVRVWQLEQYYNHPVVSKQTQSC